MAGSSTARARARASGRSRGHHSVTSRSGTGILLVLPALLFVLVFVIFPIAFAIYISMTNWPLIGTYHYIGLQNYEHITEDTAFTHAVVYTLIYTAAVTVPILIVGYAMAILVR